MFFSQLQIVYMKTKCLEIAMKSKMLKQLIYDFKFAKSFYNDFFFKFPANKIVVKTEMSLDFQNHLGKQ